MSTRYVALLRGINVGGKNKVPMAALVRIFSDFGCEQVSSYIQSGNVLFQATAAVARDLPNLIAGGIEKHCGVHSTVILRRAQEMAEVLRGNPFLAASRSPAIDPATLHVLFLADAPGAGLIARLDPGRSAPDAFAVSGRQVYLHLPNGVARTKLSNAYFDSKLTTVSTGRNWRTVTKLLELMET